MAAEAKDRMRASTYRKKPLAKRSPAERDWLARYDREREAERKLRGGLPKAAPELLPAESLDVAPPPDAFARADIPDLRDLDTPPAPEGTEGSAPADVSKAPQVLEVSHAPTAGESPAASAAPASAGLAGGGCGKCGKCRGSNRQVCPVSGSTVPQPLSEREAQALALAALAATALAVGGMYKGTPDPATPEQRGDLSAGLQSLSEKYDMHALSEVAPFLMVARALGGYAIDAKRSALAHPKRPGGIVPAKV